MIQTIRMYELKGRLTMPKVTVFEDRFYVDDKEVKVHLDSIPACRNGKHSPSIDLQLQLFFNLRLQEQPS
jgi:hypothetical protein